MHDVLEGLNQRQREAVTSTEGRVRVLAGAGSGKTRALANRFAYLVNELGVTPDSILCVTFTNKSANEMRVRIRRLTGDFSTGYIDTFHGFCVTVLREDGHAVSYPKSFLVLDNGDIDAMLKIIYEERGLTLRHMTFGDARDMIEIRKTLRTPDYYRDLIAMPVERLRERYLAARDHEDIIFYGYLYQQKKCFGLDYNDLIVFVLHLLETDEAVKSKWQRRLAYIMIDEFQDIDALQYRLMRALCAYHGNLFVVGDPDQTIYTWRGANLRFLLDFHHAFENVQTVMMMQSYRSTPEILAVANSLIERNKTRIKKDLIPVRPSGAAVTYHHAKTEAAEAEWIVREILRLNAAGTPLNDVAILYRAHYVTRVLEDAFREQELPYHIHSGVRFFDRAEIKDALSYLRMVVYRDDLSFMRVCNVPKRNLGQKRMRYLRDYAENNACSLYDALVSALEDEPFRNTKARQFVALVEQFSRACREKPVSVLLTELLDKSGYEEMRRTEGSQERLDNLAELKQAVYEFETSCGEECTPEDYLSHVALMTAGDVENRKNAVKLMTVHAAKGLEFPIVFVCALDEGVFPSKRIRTLEAMEEERRLAFVALTRAQDRLYLTSSQGRNHDGSFRYPSRFVLEIDRSLLLCDDAPDEALIGEAKWHIETDERRLVSAQEGAQRRVGERVAHSVMGEGTVTAVFVNDGAYEIQFDALTTPRRISFRVKLESIKNPTD